MYNVYIVGNAASSTHNVIRKIDFGTGKIDVFSGGGGAGYNGDGGPCFDLSVQFNNPKGLHISNFGFGTANPVLYVADYDNHAIRQIDLVTNIITTVAGDGTSGWSGDGGLATSAQLKKPTSITTDGCFSLINSLKIGSLPFHPCKSSGSNSNPSYIFSPIVFIIYVLKLLYVLMG
jgi:hypothetical protein